MYTDQHLKPFKLSPKQALIEIRKIRHTSKLDVDSYVKGVIDGLNKVIWEDDSHVVELLVRKFYSLSPMIVVCIKYLPKEE